MFDAPFRHWIAPVLVAPAGALRRWGITANQVTVAGFVGGLAAAAAITTGGPLIGITLWLLSRLCDAIDGALARQSGGGGDFGGFLDLTLDMLAYSMMVVAFASLDPVHGTVWLLVLVGYVGCITTTAVLSSILERRGVAVPENDRSLQFTAGFAEAGEATIVYLLVAILPTWTGWVATGWVVLLFATVIQRIAIAGRLLRD